MIRETFVRVQESRRITGKALSDITGISTNHVAQFRLGNKQVTTKKLWQLVEAMDQISPGAKAEFCYRMSLGKGIEVGNLSIEELSGIVLEVTEALKQKRVAQNSVSMDK